MNNRVTITPWRQAIQLISNRIDHMSQQHPQTQFISCWDFDGTLIKGDIGEGLHTGKQQDYYGLAEEAIIRGFIPKYPDRDALTLFWKDYKAIANKLSILTAYEYLVDCLYSIPAQRIEEFKALCIKLVDEHLSSYFYGHTRDLMKALNKKNVFPVIVSASPQILIDAVVHHFPVDPAFAFGVGNRVADKSPFNYGEGKVTKLNSVCDTLKLRYGKKISPVFAIGDSWENDGAMMRLACQNGGLGLCINPSYTPEWVADFEIYCTKI